MDQSNDKTGQKAEDRYALQDVQNGQHHAIGAFDAGRRIAVDHGEEEGDSISNEPARQAIEHVEREETRLQMDFRNRLQHAAPFPGHSNDSVNRRRQSQQNTKINEAKHAAGSQRDPWSDHLVKPRIAIASGSFAHDCWIHRSFASPLIIVHPSGLAYSLPQRGPH